MYIEADNNVVKVPARRRQRLPLGAIVGLYDRDLADRRDAPDEPDDPAHRDDAAERGYVWDQRAQVGTGVGVHAAKTVPRRTSMDPQRSRRRCGSASPRRSRYRRAATPPQTISITANGHAPASHP